MHTRLSSKVAAWASRSQVLIRAIVGTCLLAALFVVPAASAQSAPFDTNSVHLPADWRDVKDGVGGYPAGHMLEIALRRTHSDKLEMFKWRSEFIAMLSAQPGPLIEREWHSTAGIPENTGAGTWTGMTWWQNQQDWQNMGNMVFTSPVAAKWLSTIDMTLVFVKPLDNTFDLSTLSQSGSQVLELGILAFPHKGGKHAMDSSPEAAKAYLASLKQGGADTYQFAIYPNPTGLIGPYTVAYNKNGPPAATGERWFVYMVNYRSAEARTHLQSTAAVRHAFEGLSDSMNREHSDIQVMTRTTSEVCIKKTTNECSLDPDECHVGVMGSGDSWARSCGERPQTCVTEYNVHSNLSPATCSAVGGKLVSASPSSQP